MGQQQILLIVLSVILVGVAVSVGITMFQSQSKQGEMDNVAMYLNNVGAAAYAYYIKPTSLGGAGKDPASVATNESTWKPTKPASLSGTYTTGTAASGEIYEATMTGGGKTATLKVTTAGAITITWA
jgi:hypothetical protein